MKTKFIPMSMIYDLNSASFILDLCACTCDVCPINTHDCTCATGGHGNLKPFNTDTFSVLLNY